MKKALSLILALVMLFALAACGGDTGSSSGSTGSTGSSGGSTGGSSGDKAPEKITLRVSQTNPETDVVGRTCVHWSELVAEASDGRIEIVVYHSGQLGGERETAEACQAGNLDFALVNQSVLVNFVSEYGALDLPFVFESSEHADKVFDSELGAELLGMLDAANLKGLSIWESGFRDLTNNVKAVNTVEDVKGLRIRVMENEIHQALWRSLGADAVPMAWGDAYTALQQGAIDGQENAPTTIESNAVYEINKYLALTEHVYSTVWVVASPDTWNSLSAEDQKILSDCMDETLTWTRELRREENEAAVGRMAEKGMEVTYPDKTGFIEATAEVRNSYPQFADLLAEIAALA